MTQVMIWLAFVALVGVAGGLHELGLAPLVGWASRPFGDGVVPVLLALLALGHGAWLAAPERLRPRVLLSLSLACGLYACPRFTVLGAGWALLYRRIVWSGPSWMAPAFAVLTLVVAGAASDAADFPAFAARHPWTWEIAYLYAVGWFLRALVLWHEARHGGPCPGRVEILVYFLFAPFVLVPPYMLALPRLTLVNAARPEPAVLRSGLRWILYGLALQSAVAALGRLGLDPRTLIEAPLRARAWATAVPLAVLLYPGHAVLDAVGKGAFLLGLTRCFGVALGPAFDAPLLARGVADWWRRYNTHFRGLLVDLFWYPVALRLRRHRVLAGYAGCASVFLVGSAPLHWPKAAALVGSPYSFPWGVVAECLVMTGLVGTSLALAHRRPSRPRGPVRLWAHRAFTWVVVCAVVFGLGNQLDYRLRLQPWEEAVALSRDLDARADTAAVAREAAALVAQLEGLVAQRPRDPARRATLALALALAGDQPRARRELRLARAFAERPTPADVRALACAARRIPLFEGEADE